MLQAAMLSTPGLIDLATVKVYVSDGRPLDLLLAVKLFLALR